MNKSPLNHNPLGSIGKQMRMSKKNNSQANQFPGALGRIKSLTRNDISQDPLGVLPDQSGSNQGQANNAASIAAQQAQVAEASGLSALTQGPTGAPGSIVAPPVESGTLADTDYNNLMGGLNKGSAFAMKSPLKQGSYEDPEQVVNVDTSVADAVSKIGNTTADAVSKIGNNNNDNNEDEEEDKKGG